VTKSLERELLSELEEQEDLLLPKELRDTADCREESESELFNSATRLIAPQYKFPDPHTSEECSPLHLFPFTIIPHFA